jgi:hypothetical protein
MSQQDRCLQTFFPNPAGTSVAAAMFSHPYGILRLLILLYLHLPSGFIKNADLFSPLQLTSC